MNEDKLESLLSAGSSETEASAFFFGCGGALVGAVVNLLTTSSMTPVRAAVFAACALVLALSTVFFGIRYLRARSARQRVLKSIREGSAAHPRRILLSPTAQLS